MSYATEHCLIKTLEDGKIEITGPCCYLEGVTHTVITTQRALDLYETNQVLIQDAFPDLSIADREFIKLGYSPAGWDSLFSDEEEE